MKRKILFRGKAAAENWVEGSLILSKKNEAYIISINNNPIDVSDRQTWRIDSPAYRVNPETVCQLVFEFNGHRFFECDIIGRDGTELKYVILWNEENQCFSTFYHSEYKNINGEDELFRINTLINKEQARISVLKKYDFYPVGNIFDNPEMMNV